METIVFHIDAFWTRDSNTFRAQIKAAAASELLQRTVRAHFSWKPKNLR